MSTYYWRKQLETRDRIAERIKSIYREAIHFQWSNERIIQALKETRSTEAYRKLPLYRKEYLRGMSDLLHHQLYESTLTSKSELEWILPGVDGKLYREGDDSWLRELTDKQKSELQGFHAWRRGMDAGQVNKF